MDVRVNYLNLLGSRPLLFDGAMGTSLQAMKLPAAAFGGAAGCYDALVLSAPEAVAAVHHAFLQAGADVIETNTFRANRVALSGYQLEGQVGAINQAAAGLARHLADEFSTSTQPRFVAGAMGPAGPTNLGAAELTSIFAEQAAALIEGGVDLLLLETFQDSAELAAAVAGLKRALATSGRPLPIQAHISPGLVEDRPLLDSLLALPVEVIGLNCGYGPEAMAAPLAYLAGRTTKPIACLPNAGLPVQRDGAWHYPMQPAAFVEQVAGWLNQYGLRAVGGCCGTTAAYIKSLAKVMRNQ